MSILLPWRIGVRLQQALGQSVVQSPLSVLGAAKEGRGTLTRTRSLESVSKLLLTALCEVGTWACLASWP